MRRVAIAGVLAMEPEVLVLDEPTAGLDPAGRREIMNMFYQLHIDKGLTIVLVTHQMNDVATYADHVGHPRKRDGRQNGPACRNFSGCRLATGETVRLAFRTGFPGYIQQKDRQSISETKDRFVPNSWRLC